MANNISAGYDDVTIIEDVSIRISESEIVAIMGPNGSGKSTLLKSLLGFAKIFSGNVYYYNQEITGITANEAATMGIGYVPQLNNVFPNLTIPENLEMGAYQQKNKADIKKSIEEMYNTFPELKGRKRTLASDLSGGERQMLAIARAMMAKPKVLLLDEPLASLSPKPIATIISKLVKIRENGTAILIVEQNVQKTLGFSDRGYVLASGACVMEGASDSLFAEESAKQRYLGL